jgi:hypothetical protein
MAEIGGDGQHASHDNVFGEAGIRQAIRVANVGQLAVLANYLLPLRQGGRSAQSLNRREQALRDWGRFASNDMLQISKVVFGWEDERGRYPGLDLNGTYEAWLNAAGTFDRDPQGARAAMETCRLRMTQLPGGAELLRLYEEYRLQGKRPRSEARMWAQAVAAMRRAWRDSEPARSMPERGRAHQGAPQRDPVAGGGLDGASPVPARRGGAGVPDAPTAAAEATRLLGFPEITGPHLAQFQRQYGTAASRDGETLARQWLEHMRRSGLVDQAQHDAWHDVVVHARASDEHARWREAHGLTAAAPTPQAAAGHQVLHGQQAARHAEHAARSEAAAAEHLAGHAGQLHAVSDRTLGDAVDDPHTGHVNEQGAGRQEAYQQRKYAEVYDGMAGAVAPDRGMAARQAAARPSPATLARAQPPASLAGKRTAQVVAARPSPPQRPTPGKGMGR